MYSFLESLFFFGGERFFWEGRKVFLGEERFFFGRDFFGGFFLGGEGERLF